LDIALHPDFANNSLLYFSYSKPDVQDPALATTAVARARWDGARLNDVQDIFVGEAWYSPAISRENGRCCGQPPSDVSYGSRLEFDAEGHLFLTLGDRGWGEMAQEGMVHMGKIVRINDDGSVPADNPFIGQQGYHPTLWTLGHRNPLGLAINPGNGDIWAAEFGPSGGDELNLIQKGANYGWALVSKGVHYSGDLTPLGHDSPPGMEEPVLYWVPSINPGNLAFYNADAFPAWKGNLLMSTLSGSVRRFTFDDNGKPVEAERMLSEIAQRFRDITVGPDGYLYLLTDEPDGVMLQVRPQ
ncbi:MAG: PQQ-dependent sugar dehydrogenase, partial [Pseudomonadales bacterium]|nr:PQQ-dependent sugar dehydrogenase [Pseudomonadales bacterium]